MKEKLIEQIESKLETLENEAASKAVSNATMKKNISEVKDFIYRSIKFANTINEPFTEEEQKVYLDRSDKLMKPYKVSYLSTKKLVASVAIMAATGVGALAGISSLCMHGCGTSNVNEIDAIDSQNIETEMPEIVKPTEMDAEYKEMADEIVVSMNDAISKGFNVTSENKYNMSKMYVEYYMLNQMDELTDEQWANIFQNSTTTAKDLMNSKESLEWIDEQRVTIASEDMMLDYSYMFDGADLKLLTDAKDLMNQIKITTGKDRKQAIADFKQYILDNLNSENVRIQYSERALDTFRAVYFDAFDTLTNGKEIDDELEHAINTTITCSLSETVLDVEDKTIKSLQSIYGTYLLDKLEVRLSNGWVYVSNNEVNPYNDINEISKYVSENIDLSLYKELPDYEEVLNEMFLSSGAEKSKNDSGVSNGNGGNISNAQFNKYGIDPSSPTAREELEQAVQEETKKQEEESIRVEDGNGNVIQTSDYIDGFNAGYSAAMNGQSKPAYTGNQSYNAGLDSGWSKGLADKQAFENNFKDDTETEYVPVENGETTIIESEPITEDYTDSEDNNYMDEETTFVPIDEVDAGYTRAIKETDEKISELLAYRDFLAQYASVEEINQENQIRL